MNGGRIRTDLDIAEMLCNRFATVSVAIVNSDPEGDLAPNLFAVWMTEASGELEVDDVIPMDPFVMQEIANHPHGTEVVEEMVRAVFSAGCFVSDERPMPDAMVYVSEAWWLRVTVAEGEEPPPMPDSIADHPGRTQALLTVVHLPGGCHMSMCPVEGEGAERRATFKPFDRDGVAVAFKGSAEVVH